MGLDHLQISSFGFSRICSLVTKDWFLDNLCLLASKKAEIATYLQESDEALQVRPVIFFIII